MMIYSVEEGSTLNETSELHSLHINGQQTGAASVKATDCAAYNKQKFQIIKPFRRLDGEFTKWKMSGSVI